MPKFDILKPADVDLIKDCANQIREFKDIVETLLKNGHTFPPQGSSATGYGYHRNDLLFYLPRCIVNSTPPPLSSDGVYRSALWFNENTKQLYWWDNSEMKWIPVNTTAGASIASGTPTLPTTLQMATQINLSSNQALLIDAFAYSLTGGYFTDCSILMNNTVIAKRNGCRASYIHMSAVYTSPVSGGILKFSMNGSGTTREVHLVAERIYLD